MELQQAQHKIEYLIHNLLVLHDAPDIAADYLLKHYENETTSFEELKVISQFLLNCGFYATLVNFLTRKLKYDEVLPWGHFAEALIRSNMSVSLEVRKAVIEGAKSQKALGELSLCQQLDTVDEKIVTARESRKKSFLKKQLALKEDLLAQYEMFKSQGLIQEEHKLIDRFVRFFPQDPSMAKAKELLHERQAMDLLFKKSQTKAISKKNYYYETLEPELEPLFANIENYMLQELQKDATLGLDFMVCQLMWDRPDSALKIAEHISAETESGQLILDWLMAESYLRARRFVELLNHIAFLEAKYVHDPEITFAALYLRAQALWGMEQKYSAMEMMESLLAARPKYRSAHALLDEWKESFL